MQEMGCWWQGGPVGVEPVCVIVSELLHPNYLKMFLWSAKEKYRVTHSLSCVCLPGCIYCHNN